MASVQGGIRSGSRDLVNTETKQMLSFFFVDVVAPHSLTFERKFPPISKQSASSEYGIYRCIAIISEFS